MNSTISSRDGWPALPRRDGPLLAAHGGGFRYYFTVAKVLKSASEHPINRVFAIYFSSKTQMEAFFANPDYLAIKAKFFAKSVAGTTIFGGYER